MPTWKEVVQMEGEPVKFAVLDIESGNAVSFFDSIELAEKALWNTVQEVPEEADHLVMVAYDKIGDALWSVPASSMKA